MLIPGAHIIKSVSQDVMRFECTHCGCIRTLNLVNCTPEYIFENTANFQACHFYCEDVNKNKKIANEIAEYWYGELHGKIAPVFQKQKLAEFTESKLSELQPIKEVKPDEYILCAAIHFDDGKEYAHQPLNIKTGRVFCGHRHHNIFQLISGNAGERVKSGIIDEEQGFITNKNRFVKRAEARTIALEAGQLAGRTVHHRTDLFSEDLY